MSGSGHNNSNGPSPDSPKDEEFMEAAKVVAVGVGVLAGAALAVKGIFSLFSGSSETPVADERETMKAPGRDAIIYRDDFERDPATYFRDLRRPSRD